MNKRVIGGIIVVLVILIVAVIVVNQNKDTPEEPVETGLPWYEGGDLHQSLVADWKEATYRNQLATCAAFVYFENRDLAPEEFKKRSQELRDCIDEEAYKERKVDIGNQKISTIAARCTIDLGHKRKNVEERRQKKEQESSDSTDN